MSNKGKLNDDYVDSDNDKIDIRDFEISEAEEDNSKNKRKADSEPAKKGTIEYCKIFIMTLLTYSIGRPAKKAKYVFNAEDKKKLLEGAQKYGTSYASIQKEYFNDKDPAVTRGDIANEFKKSKFLSQVATEGINIIILVRSSTNYLFST
jgi:hypothetical protein